MAAAVLSSALLMQDAAATVGIRTAVQTDPGSDTAGSRSGFCPYHLHNLSRRITFNKVCFSSFSD